MAGPIPVERLYHATVVVRDLHAAARNYAEVYGIERWRVVRCVPERLTDARAFGSRTGFSFSTATGSNLSGVTFQLVQPHDGFSSFQEFLLTRGEGIHGFCTAELSKAEFDELYRWLAAEGVEPAQSLTLDSVVSQHYFDMRPLLGNLYVQVTVPLRENWQAAIKVDEEWDFSGRFLRPPGIESALNIERVGHFGIVVDSLSQRLPHYARLFGLGRWRGTHFKSDEGVLDLEYRGPRSEQAFLMALTQVADFGLELIQPTEGVNHYREDYAAGLGTGIHHMLLQPNLAPEDQPQLQRWMEGMGAPVVLSGHFPRNGASFYYYDTREKLGGYVYEVICREQARAQNPSGALAYEFDFSEA